MADSRPIAFFDSGLGGISVLRETVRLLPEENYLYYGDSLHAPYGVKTVDEVTARSRAIVRHLLDEGAKAIVIACNTATSAAANTLRVPIIGTEPALKPAVERHPGGRILVMATAMTVKEQKFQALRAQYEQQAEIIPIPCSGLMEFVEQGILRGEQLLAYLFEKLSPYLKVPVDAVVLGCTHYPLVKEYFRRYLPSNVRVVSQDELMGDKLKDYLHRHAEIETRLDKNHCYQFGVSRLNKHYRQLADMLFPGIDVAEYKKETGN